jgi:hypothetical protein
VLRKSQKTQRKVDFFMREQGEYVNKLFERMDLRQIREFLLYGTEDSSIETENYHVRLKQGSDPIYNRLISLYPNEADRENAGNDLSQALAAHDAVYMEIGMKAGARLVYQLLLTDEPTPPTERSTP